MTSSTSGDGDKVVAFPASEATPEERDSRRLKHEVEQVTPEERARRLRVEVERLVRLPVSEWMFWLDSVAEERGIDKATLKQMIEETVKENEKKRREAEAEKRRIEQRAEKQRADEQQKEKREKEREQERADKAAEKKEKEKAKAFAALIKLPKVEHEKQLIELAKRLDEDLELLKDEFTVFADSEEEKPDIDDVEPWPDPIDTRVLLTGVITQFRRYVVAHDEASVAIVLWIFFAWVHEAIAVHSPLLVFTSAEGDTGKTTACGVIQQLTPRSYPAAELTGPNLYRFVDHVHPTLIIDDADRLLERKPDLVHIINVSWTRGTRIPRQDHGVTRWFDPFCPKVIAGVNVRLPKTTATRPITVKLWPKLRSDKVERFRHSDDDEFLTLRRKLARWAADNAAALKDARPVMPPGFNNRAVMNWELLLAIADLAGGDWPKLARQAAIKLSRQRREPSENKRLLGAFRELFSKHGSMLTSADVQRLLTADPISEWADFRGHGPISQRQIAVLLDPFDIHPDVIHPKGRRAERGYKAEWFARAFLHFLGTPAGKCSSVRKGPEKPRK
jgi:putative DNA primase/helicase